MVVTISRRSCFLIAIAFCVAASTCCIAASTPNDLHEIPLTQDYGRTGKSLGVSFHKFYSGAPYRATLILETKLNGVVHHSELPLGLMSDVRFNSVILLDNKKLTVHISVGKRSAPGGVLSFERQYPNPFSLGNSRRALLRCSSIDALAKVAPRSNGDPIELVFGPVRTGLSESAKERALRDYQSANYILLRLL